MFIVQKFSGVHVQEWKLTSEILKKEKGKKLSRLFSEHKQERCGAF